MRRVTKERIAAAVLLGVAVMLLLGGMVRSHKVYDRSTEEFGLVTFTRVSDGALIIDATFSGAERIGDRLYTTYDRSVPRGKQACPT